MAHLDAQALAESKAGSFLARAVRLHGPQIHTALAVGGKRALAAQEQVTAIARELETAAARTAEQVEAAQAEGRELRKRADDAAVAKEMVRRSRSRSRP